MEREIKKELRAGRIPSLLGHLKKRQEITIGSLITDYLADGAPDRKLQPRAGNSLENQKNLLAPVTSWWAGKNPNLITQADCDGYWRHRKLTVTKGTGDRTAEIELASLSNVLTWATRAQRIDANRILHRPSYRTKVRHCRDCMPTSSDELHLLAIELFKNRRSEALGWQLLLEAFTGMRTEETRRLRSDAQRIGTNVHPGFTDDRYLYIERVKRGIHPQIQLDDPDRPHIRTILEGLKAWRAQRYPNSPWFLPGLRADGADPVSETALTSSLQEVAAALKLPDRTSHGARAYYCTTRRCQGIDDARIAIEMGQSSGPDLIRKVYGEIPPNWKGLANTFTWLPASVNIKPAWEFIAAKLASEDRTNIVQLAVNQ